jgi:hypothetical protein
MSFVARHPSPHVERFMGNMDPWTVQEEYDILDDAHGSTVDEPLWSRCASASCSSCVWG